MPTRTSGGSTTKQRPTPASRRAPVSTDDEQPHPGGRKVTARMPVLLADGSVVRPRAKGSRAEQPPVRMGQITRSLPLVRSESDIPYRGIMSGSGRLIRLYRDAHAVCEEIWQFLEQMEQGLFDKGDELQDKLSMASRDAEEAPRATARRPTTASRRSPARTRR